MKLSIPQQVVFHSRARNKVLIAGRRFGKTMLSIAIILNKANAKRANGKNRVVWYIAPYYTQAKEIAWQMLKEVLLEKRWVSSQKNFNESSLTVTLKNKNIIKLKGADNYDSLRGVGLDFVVLDEFQDMKPEAWFEVVRPMLSDTNGEAFFVGTPKGFTWSFDLWQKGQKGSGVYNSSWGSWQFTTLQGGNVPKEEIEEARKDLDEKTFRQEYLGSFETYAGIVYYAFDRQESIIPYNKPDNILFQATPLHIGMDFNLSPMAATISVETQNYTHTFDEIIIYSSDTREMSEEIRTRYPHNPIYIYPDPACRQNRTSAGGMTDLKILQDPRYRFMPRVRNTHSLIRDRVNAVNSRLKNANGERKAFITPNCKHLIKCITTQLYKEGTMQPDKSSNLDHLPDAYGYHIDYLYPISNNLNSSFAPRG